MMDKGNPARSKYWWLWPSFYSEKDARDGATMGVIAAGFIVLATVGVYWYGYSKDGDVYTFAVGLFVGLVWCVLGYGFHRLSRVCAIIGLMLFLFDKIQMLLAGESLGIAVVLGLYLIHTTRASFWWHSQKKKEETPAPTID